jgi:hypothetical protein
MSEKNQTVFQDNDKRAKRAIIWRIVPVVYGIVIIIISILLAIFGGFVMATAGIEAPGGAAPLFIITLALLVAIIGLVGISIASLVFYLMWVHRAHQNAEAMSGEKLFLSAGWNVGFHFIPLANLIIPYLLMLQIAEKSSSEGAKNITLTWWILILIANGGSFLINLFSFSSSFVSGFSSSYSDSSAYNSPFATSSSLLELVGGSIINLISLAVFVISFFVIHLVNKGQKERAEEMGLLSKQTQN